jgi:hypothetical protein
MLIKKKENKIMGTTNTKTQSNGDVIRNMSNADLAAFISAINGGAPVVQVLNWLYEPSTQK